MACRVLTKASSPPAACVEGDQEAAVKGPGLNRDTWPEQALQAYTALNHQPGQDRRRGATAAHCPEDRRLRLHIHARNLYVDDGDKQPALTAGKR